jgi:recombination protein U
MMANTQYRRRGLADIQKQEVPTIFDRRTGRGFPREKAIVDFIGFYIKQIDKSRQRMFMPVAFDAKETRSTTRFDLSNIYDHQYQYLRLRYELGTESFLLINFVKHNQYYRLEFPQLQKAWEGWKSSQGVTDYSNIASIPYEWFASNLKPVKSKGGVVLDYLCLV